MNADACLRVRFIHDLSKNNPVPLKFSIQAKNNICNEVSWILLDNPPIMICYGVKSTSGKSTLLNKLLCTDFEVSNDSNFFKGTIDV